MSDREALLHNLAVGDIFHAQSPNGASLICLTVLITESSIQARTVTNQIQLVFDRQTGTAEWGEDRVPCTIDSITPLPLEVYNVILGIDRKFRLERNPERIKLNEDEVRVLLFVDSHYSSNQL